MQRQGRRFTGPRAKFARHARSAVTGWRRRRVLLTSGRSNWYPPSPTHPDSWWPSRPCKRQGTRPPDGQRRHRARAGNLAQLRGEGYTVVQGIATPYFAARLRETGIRPARLTRCAARDAAGVRFGVTACRRVSCHACAPGRCTCVHPRGSRRRPRAHVLDARAVADCRLTPRTCTFVHPQCKPVRVRLRCVFVLRAHVPNTRAEVVFATTCGIERRICARFRAFSSQFMAFPLRARDVPRCVECADEIWHANCSRSLRESRMQNEEDPRNAT